MAVSISISIAQNSQSITNNTSNVTVTVKASWTGGSWNAVVKADGTPQANGSCTINGTKYTFASTFNTSHTSSGSQTIFTKTLNISHNSDGTKTLSVSASYNTYISSGTVSASASKVLTTIPRKSTLAASNGTLGTSQKLTVTRQATSFTHTITYKCGSASGTICTKSSSTSISWTPPLSLASQNTTGTSVSITFTITTYSGSTNIGSNIKTISCAIPSSVKPSCTVTVTDPTGNADTYGAFVRGLSKFKVVVTPTTSYGSAISAYKTTANGATYTTASFTTGVLSSSGTLKVVATVTDKRKRSGSTTVSKTVINYSNPIVSKLQVKRCNEDGSENDRGEYVQVTFSASITSLNNKNTASYRLRYKKSSDGTYTEVALTDFANNYTVTDATYIFAADSGSSYDVEFSATDSHGTTTRITTASTAFTLMHWNTAGNGMGIGKISELENVLDVGVQTRFFGGIMYMVLEPETDLNDVRTPNFYVGDELREFNYTNCPVSNGTFTLVVESSGVDGQVKQRYTYCSKTASRVYERFYYQSTWGEWVCVSDFDGQLLWDGVSYMAADSTANLSEPISKQKSGIVLVFSEYVNGAAADQSFHCRFIPKMRVSMHPGKADCIELATSNMSFYATKYLYISDTKITGHANNNTTGTGACGITYTNNRFVLRYVIGV